jgi:hypothetical protein
MRLESEDLVFQLADWSGLGEAETLGGLLHGADHRWGTAEKDLDIGSWLWKVFLQHISNNSSCALQLNLR